MSQAMETFILSFHFSYMVSLLMVNYINTNALWCEVICSVGRPLGYPVTVHMWMLKASQIPANDLQPKAHMVKFVSRDAGSWKKFDLKRLGLKCSITYVLPIVSFEGFFLIYVVHLSLEINVVLLFDTRSSLQITFFLGLGGCELQ